MFGVKIQHIQEQPPKQSNENPINDAPGSSGVIAGPKVDASIFGVNRGEVFPAVPAQRKRCELPCFLRIAATIRRQMLQT